MICANANYISGSGSNSKRKWDHDEYWYECKGLDDGSCCRDEHGWNPKKCDFERNKACKIDKYLDIKKLLT